MSTEPTRTDETAEDAANEAAAWIARARDHEKRLVEVAIHSLADLDCDLSAGDTYAPDDYLDRAQAVVNGLLAYMAWTTEFTRAGERFWRDRIADEIERAAEPAPFNDAPGMRVAAAVARGGA